MKRVDRYHYSLIIPSIFIGVGFYLSLFLVRAFFDIVDLSLRQGIPILKASYIIILTLPALLVMTIPMGVLFGYLSAFSSLQRNHEMLALLSLGFSRAKIMKPYLIAAFITTVLSAIIMLVIVPSSNKALVDYRLSLLKGAVTQNLHPRQFLHGFTNKVLYANEMNSGKTRWSGVTIFESEYPTQKILTADKALLFTDSSGSELWLKLSNVVSHITRLNRWDETRYQINTNREQNILLKRINPRGARSVSYMSLQEMSVKQLYDRTRTAPTDRDKRRAMIELYRKFTLPLATFLFAWLALAYAMRKPQMKTSSAFVLSLFFILIYYIFMSIWENMAVEGKFPPLLASWGPAGIVIIIGLFFTLHFSFGVLVPQKIKDGLSRLKPDWVGVKGLGRFPTLVDTYLWTNFLFIFLFCITALSVLFVVVDFTQIVDEIQRHNIPAAIWGQRYLYLLPDLIYQQIAPISFIIALTLTIGFLERHKEMTAFRSLGVSLHRLVVPFIMVAFIVGAGGFILGETLLPLSNQKALRYFQIIKGRDPGKISGLLGEFHLLMTGENHVLGYRTANIPDESLSKVFIVEWGKDGAISRRIQVEKVVWHEDHWVMLNGWERTFAGDKVLTFKRFNRHDFPYPEGKSDLLVGLQKPQEMGFFALRSYIRQSKRSGHVDPGLSVRLWGKWVTPLSMLVLTLIGYGLIFRFSPRHGTTLWQIGLSLGVAFLYWALVALFFKLGELGALPPPLAAFTPVVFLGMIGLYTFFDISS